MIWYDVKYLSVKVFVWFEIEVRKLFLNIGMDILINVQNYENILFRC